MRVPKLLLNLSSKWSRGFHGKCAPSLSEGRLSKSLRYEKDKRSQCTSQFLLVCKRKNCGESSA
jgi:hypothetical protein